MKTPPFTPTIEVWTLTPDPSFRLRVIATPSLRMRAAPSTSAQTLGQLPTGAIVELTGEISEGEGLRWVQVQRRVDTNENLCRPGCPWMAAGTLGGTVNYLSGLE
jgi:hypothetical protein